MEKHFCVSVHIYDREKKQFLLIKHKKLGKWLQPGGHIELNESPEEAALREVYEETGLKVQLVGNRIPREEDYILPLAIQKNKIKEDHIHIDFVYGAIPIDNQNLVLNEIETDGIQWFTLQEILNDNFDTFEDLKYWCKKIAENY